MDTALNMSNDLTNVLQAADNAFSEVYRQEKNCVRLGGAYTLHCIMAAYDKYLFRKFSWVKNMIYPWSNYDWDYAQFIDNLYDPKRGVNDIRGGTITISGKADIEEMVNTVEVIIKLLFSLTTDANPNKKSSASIKFKKNKYSDLPDCINVEVRDKLISLRSQMQTLKNKISPLQREVNKKMRKYQSDLKKWRYLKAKYDRENFQDKNTENIENFYIFGDIGRGISNVGKSIGGGISNVGRSIGGGINNIGQSLGKIFKPKPPKKPKYPYGIQDTILKTLKQHIVKISIAGTLWQPPIRSYCSKKAKPLSRGVKVIEN